jgi:hypothetical protein
MLCRQMIIVKLNTSKKQLASEGGKSYAQALVAVDRLDVVNGRL